MKPDSVTVLELVQEARISEFLKDPGDKRYEASGVHLKDGYFHIIFDDDPHLLRLRPDWLQADEAPELLDLQGTGAGYEDITFRSSTNCWYCLIEAAETKSGDTMPRLDEFDESFAFIKSYWLEFPLQAGNKGFEGLSTLRYAGDDYLLGLCEGNDCKGGSAGRQPGKGRIQAFKWTAENWEHVGTIKLPESVRFKDYASLDFRNGYLTVISQASSAMWVGRLCLHPAGLEDLFADDRQPVVSDKGKPDQPGRCARKDQSVHIFRLPDGSQPVIQPPLEEGYLV
jgi:hypothetical protein